MKQRKGNGQRSKKNRSKKSGPPLSLVSPFAPMMNRTFRYNDTWSATEAALGAGVFYSFSPSSLYDPNSTGVGHQPMYYDQLFTATGPYTKYLALSTLLTLNISNISANVMTGVIYASANNTSPASLAQALEKPWSIRFMLAGNTGGPCVRTLKFAVPHHTAMGITKQHLLTDDYYAGVYNGSPSVNAFINIYLASTAIGAGAITANFELDINANCYALGNTSTS